jgi:hypothetical protein
MRNINIVDAIVIGAICILAYALIKTLKNK